MLGSKTEAQRLMVAGSRSGAPQPSPRRSTRQRLAPSSLKTVRVGKPHSPSSARPGSTAGRLETKTKNDPSGAITGSESPHWPEKDATVGALQVSPWRWAVTIVRFRVKKTVLPSGLKAGGAVITPGSKSAGSPVEPEATPKPSVEVLSGAVWIGDR